LSFGFLGSELKTQSSELRTAKMTLVKICGLRTAEHALAAFEAGADMLGFILAPARRQISPTALAEIAREVRGTEIASGRRASLVGVFVDEAAGRIEEIAGTCGLDAIQLSGAEPVALAERLAGRSVFKAVRLAGAAHEAAWMAGQWPNVRLLVDAHVPGLHGGAGVVADWAAAAALARERPIVLAGGLTPANVGEAIRQVRPWAVDVSSGVETDGVKDSAKIRAFVAAVRAVDEHQNVQCDSYDVPYR
jgi:phosphoribosylanthranilate isomerase